MSTPIRIPFVNLAGLHEEIGAELEAAVLAVCRHQHFVGGPEIAEFERGLADYLEVAHVVGVANGTDALELSLRALGIGAGAEVIVPGNTFIATAEAVAACGARVRFADVDPRSGLIAAETCEPLIGEATKALIPVHLYGRVAEMAPLRELADRYRLAVVEDAAQSHGARTPEGRPGGLGRAGCFSFYPGKNLGAFGDAGAVSTDDEALVGQIRLMRDHGRVGRDEHAVIGRNSRLDTIQAAVLAAKISHLDDWTRRRRRVAELYRELLPTEVLDWRSPDPEAESHHIFPILLDDRDGLAAALREAGIASTVHYRQAVPATAAFSDGADPCPVAEDRARRLLSLPISPHISDVEVGEVAAIVSSWVGQREASAIGPVGGRST